MRGGIFAVLILLVLFAVWLTVRTRAAAILHVGDTVRITKTQYQGYTGKIIQILKTGWVIVSCDNGNLNITIAPEHVEKV